MNWFVKKREETKIEIKYLCYINPNAIYKVIRSQDNTGEWLLKKNEAANKLCKYFLKKWDFFICESKMINYVLLYITRYLFIQKSFIIALYTLII